MASLEDELAAKYQGQTEDDLASKYGVAPPPPPLTAEQQNSDSGMGLGVQFQNAINDNPVKGWASGFEAGWPTGPENTAYREGKDPKEELARLAIQEKLTPKSYAVGKFMSGAIPALAAALATGGSSIPVMAAGQVAEGTGEGLIRGKTPLQASEGGLVQGGLAAGGGILAKGVGAGLTKLGDMAGPTLRKLAVEYINKQGGNIGSDFAKMVERGGPEALEKNADLIGPYIRPTVEGTSKQLSNVVDTAEQARSAGLKALDERLAGSASATPDNGVAQLRVALQKEGYPPEVIEKTVQSQFPNAPSIQTPSGPVAPTVGDVVENAKRGLDVMVNKNPALADHADAVRRTLDKYLDRWGPDEASFTKIDDMRRQLQDAGKFDNLVPDAVSQLYRGTSRVVRQQIDNSAKELAPDLADKWLGAKQTLSQYLGPAEVAQRRSAMLQGQSTPGIMGLVGGVSSAGALAAAGKPGAAMVAGGLSLLQKPARQVASYGAAKGANWLAGALEGSDVGGMVTRSASAATPGVARGLFSDKLYPDQVGQLAERLGAPQAPDLKRAAEGGDTLKADALHQYLLANNPTYAQTMGAAGTSQDRRQP